MGVLAASTVACQDTSTTDRQLVFASLSDALREPDGLSKLPTLKTATVWNWPQTLAHCAQSAEYSITGFPQPKSALFQSTAGAVAFKVFSWRGRVGHDLAEPIPRAPSLGSSTAPEFCLLRSDKSCVRWGSLHAPSQLFFGLRHSGLSPYARRAVPVIRFVLVL